MFSIYRRQRMLDIQGFRPTKIVTTTAGTAYTFDRVLAIRLSAESEYFINADSANKTSMPPGASVIDERVTSVTFTNATTIELMEM